jgi:hypothetical protein
VDELAEEGQLDVIIVTSRGISLDIVLFWDVLSVAII